MAGPLAFTFGVLGNIISFLVYLAPVPTFHRIHRKKSTEGFHCVPYVIALFSAMLWSYYALLKRNDILLLSINAIGCVVEIAYIAMFLFYAPEGKKAHAAKLVGFTNVGVFGIIVASTLLLSNGPRRLRILGWICVAFSVSVFAAPLSIMRLVIKTRSVEFMPLYLSCFLTASAVVWFGYGFFSCDPYVAAPNVLGFLFGFIQIVLYACYRRSTAEIIERRSRDPENLRSRGVSMGGPEVHPEEIHVTILDEGLNQQERVGDEDGQVPMV